jgi:hypothetical protein
MSAPPTSYREESMSAQMKAYIAENRQVEGFVTVYSNNVAITANFFDVAMVFGETVGQDGDKVTVDQRARVVMTPSQTKILIAALIQQMLSYEQLFGEIVIPPGIVSDLASEPMALLKSLSDASRQQTATHPAPVE